MKALDEFMPAGQEIEPAGHNVFTDGTGICSKREYLPTLREQKGDMLVFILAEIHHFQGIKVPLFKELSRMLIIVDFDGIGMSGGFAIIQMRCFMLAAIEESGVQPQDIAKSTQHKFCLGDIALRQIEQYIDVRVSFHLFLVQQGSSFSPPGLKLIGFLQQ